MTAAVVLDGKRPRVSGLKLCEVESGREWSLAPGKNVFGREPRCDIPLEHETISRFHGMVLWDGVSAQVDVVDFKSTNGLWFDDERVDEATLQVGRKVMFLGGVEVRLTAESIRCDAIPVVRRPATRRLLPAAVSRTMNLAWPPARR